PETPHSTVDLQMNRLWPRPQSLGSIAEHLHMPGFPYGGGQVLADYLILFATPESGHQQNAAAHSGRAQRHTFIGGCHPQPLGPYGLERQGARGGAMSVGVRLDHRAYRHAWAHVTLDGAEVFPQCA